MFQPEIYFTRLLEDAHDLALLAERCPALEVRARRPDLIEVRYRVAGLHRLPQGEIVTAREHYAQFFCPPEYPVEMGPLARVTTPGVQHVHPNICPLTGMICYGVEPEHWAPSLGLDGIVLLVARMLRLEIFNLTSVMDTAWEAARYVRQLAEQGRTPLDEQALLVQRADEFDIELARES